MAGDPVCVERRRHERRPLQRPCKLLHAPTLRYIGAATRDLSPGGALLELFPPRPIAVGDRVDVLVDWSVCGLVNRESVIGATVVRLGADNGSPQEIGVEFDRELAAPFAG